MFMLSTRWYILVIVAIVAWFLWDEVRPTITGGYCHKKSVESAATGSGRIDIPDYERFYDMCRKKWGL